MDYSSISGVTAASDLAAAPTTTGTTALGQDAFLRLLTTQMQYQDPLEPMSNEEFVSQLAQFSSLEQLQDIGSSMDSLYAVGISQNNASMVGLLGKTVVAQADSFHYDGTDGTFVRYDAAAAAEAASLTISDSDGNIVFYEENIGSLAEGEGSYLWNGKGTDGGTLAAGDYTFSITATDTDGDPVSVNGLLRGTVTEMDYSSGSPAPSVEGIDIGIGDILRVEPSESE
jgi:flagellar basal-body rod modification protein FlgD